MTTLDDNNFNINSNNNNMNNNMTFNDNNESKAMTNSFANNTNSLFSDEDFKTPTNEFVEELDVLEKKSTSVLSGEASQPSFNRMSLFKQFDPLVELNEVNTEVNNGFINDMINKTNNIGFNEFHLNVSECDSAFATTNGTDIISNANESTTLMNFNSPLVVTNSGAKAHSIQHNVNKTDVFFSMNDSRSCDQLSNALQMKELLFEEKLIEKDKQIDSLEEKLNTAESNCEKYGFLLNLLHNFNEEVVEMASQLIETLMTEKNELIERCNQMTAERGQALEDVNSVEKSFYEVHNRYDKVRTALEECKQRELQFNEQYLELMDKLNEKEQMYELLKENAEEKIQNANAYIESARRESESELIAVKAQLKRSEMRINSLQSQLDQKSHENEELTKMVDELIANVEK